MVNGDEPLIVRHDVRFAAGVVQNIKRDLAPQQAASGIDFVGPELIALLKRLSIGRKITRERSEAPIFTGPTT